MAIGDFHPDLGEPPPRITPAALLRSLVMSLAAFDALAAARNLEAAGLERAQAEAIAGAVRDATGSPGRYS